MSAFFLAPLQDDGPSLPDGDESPFIAPACGARGCVLGCRACNDQEPCDWCSRPTFRRVAGHPMCRHCARGL